MPLKKRKRYHSQLVWCFHTNKEHLLRKELQAIIPASTKSTWRNRVQDFTGTDFIPQFQESLDFFELTAEHQRLRRILIGVGKSWINCYSWLQPLIPKTQVVSNHITKLIQQVSQYLPLKQACKLFDVSLQSYYYRVRKSVCSLSPLQLCLKKHPNQLATGEINTIKAAFQNEYFSSWPAISIYYYLLRKKTLNISLSTFYKYVNQLHLKRKTGKEMTNTIGIRATAPNQFLHVDTTYKKLLDGTKAAVVFVSDNYSKAILGYHLAPENNSRSVIQALQMTIQHIANYHPEHKVPVTLIADGGKENHANTISDLLSNQKDPPISKVIARKDIRFSNSSVEAINKIYKRYLRNHPPENIEQLRRITLDFLEDYNHIRPHGSIKGFTPWESYTQKQPKFTFSEQIKAQRSIRREENRKMSCESNC